MLIVFQSTLWMLFGVIAYRGGIVNANIPKLLGRILYWLGVPLQIFFLARKSNFEQTLWLPPIVTVIVLFSGLAIALLVLRLFKYSLVGDRFQDRFAIGLDSSSIVRSSLVTVGSLIKPDSIVSSTKFGAGSFILASILGNTGFIGLALIPPLIDRSYWSWVVLYGVVHNILGSYGLGVMIADYYSYSNKNDSWLGRLQKLLVLPSLWAFAYGYTSRNLPLPQPIETAISKAVLLVVPGAFILIGMQLGKLQQWQNLQAGIFPTVIKMLVLPGITGLLLTCFGIRGDSRLVLVLMSSMPTAFASIILAEAYNLDRQIPASSIAISTLSLPIILFLWLTIF